MSRRGIAPPAGGWRPWLILIAALVIAAAAAGMAKVPQLATGLAIAAAAVGPTVVALSTAFRSQLEQRAKTAASRRELTEGAPAGSILVRDVSATQVRVHAAVRDDVEFISRDRQPDAVEALRLRRRLLLAGPSMTGKTRLALTVAKMVAPDHNFHRPADGKSLHTRLAGGNRFGRVLVWLDDLERYTATGLTDADLTTLLDAPDVLVVATVRTSEYDALQPNGEIKPVGWEVPTWFGTPVWVSHRWSDQELNRLAETRTGSEVLDQARAYGLANYLAGAPLIDQQLAIGPDQHPVGHAVVRAAVDWRRIGMEQKLSAAILTAVIGDYTPLRTATDRAHQIADGIAWATHPLNQTVSLVTDNDGLEAVDLVMDRFSTSADPVPSSLTEAAIATAGLRELLSLGYHGYSNGQIGLAVRVWEAAAAVGNAVAMFNLGVLAAERVDSPDLVGAQKWWVQAAAAGDTDAMFNLGVLLIDGVDSPDLAGARRWWEQAAAGDHTVAMFNLGNLLVHRINPPDVNSAQSWYEKAAAAGHSGAMHNLGNLLALLVDPPDLAGARKWWEQAAAAGNTGAMVNLGNMLLARVEPSDLAGARDWWELAAAAGHAEAMYMLGVLLADKVDPPDLVGAQKWWEQAAAAGHAGAQARMKNLTE